MERKVNIDKIEDANVKISKIENLLGYLIEKDYSAINAVNEELSGTTLEYVFNIKYHDTQNVLDIIQDYVISMKKDIEDAINSSIKEN
ncbi:MAG: hypothetical protein ACI4ON_00455 [Clostridia bacterium]